jgi:hypothetical protein
VALLTTAETAAFLRRPEGTLRYWRSIGYGPAYVKMGRVRYQQSDVESFIKSNIVTPSVRTEAQKEAYRVAL